MKFSILILLACFLLSCKKNNVQPKTQLTLSGTFSLYRKADTSYMQGGGKDYVSAIVVMSLSGDTAYLNPGQSDYAVVPNEIVNYSPASFLADTISFATGSSGTETGIDFPSPGNFTYSLNTNAFSIDNINYSGTYTIKAINSSTVELKIISISSTTETEGQALFFRKDD